MSNRSAGQQRRRDRERAAEEAAQAAAAIPDDSVMISQPSQEPESEQSARKDDGPRREFEVGNKARNEAFEEVVRARRDREEASRQEAQESQDSVPAAETVSASEQPAPATGADAPVQDSQPAPAPMVRVKVDGEEFDVPQADVDAAGGVAAYQIQRGAEKRLASAKEAEKAAKSLLAQLQQAAAPKPEPERKPEEIIRDAVAKIQVATPEEGAAALAHVLQQFIPKAPDTQQITYQAMMLMRVTEAEDKFVRENADLVGNPILKSLVISEKQKRLEAMRQSQNLPADWNSFYAGIASDIRAAIGRPVTTPVQAAQQPTPPVGSVATDARVQRKASITALPTASQRAALPEEQKPPTREELLNEMRKSRGQPV